MRQRMSGWWGAGILAVGAVLGCGGGGNGPVARAGATNDTGGADPPASGNGGPPSPPGTGGRAGSGTTVPAGTTIFAQNYGDETEQALAGMAVDGAGNIYVAGNETAYDDTGTIVNGVFLLQYSSDGILRWRQPFSGPRAGEGELRVTGVAVQPTTKLEILAGSFLGTVTLGDQVLTSGKDPQSGLSVTNLWLAAVDSAGYLVWARVISSAGYVFPDQVFVTSSGDIEVTGGMTDNASVGGAPLCCGNGITGPRFVARFNPQGDPIWSNGVTGYFRPVRAGADADGGLVLGGFAEGPFGYGGETFSSGGGPYDLFSAVVLRLDPQGNKRWIRTFVNPPGGSLAGAGLDPSGNVVLFGQFSGPFDAGGGQTFTGPAPASGQMDGVIAKLAPDGTTEWAQQIPGGLGQQFGASLATNAAGDIALMNSGDGFSTGPTIGGVSLLPPGGTGHYIIELGPDGRLLWTRSFATISIFANPTTALAFTASGQLAAAGNFSNTVDFGTGPLTVPGQLTRSGSGPEGIPDNVFTLLLAP